MADLEPLDFRRAGGHEDALQLARGFEVLFHAALAQRQFLVEARVFDRAGDLRREQRERAHVVVGEEADAVAFEVDYADHAVLRDERHGDLGADIGVGGDVARVLGGFVNADGFARLGGGAGDALAEGDVIDLYALVVAARKAVAQQLLLVIDEQDAEGVVGDDAAHGGSDFAQ